MNIKLALEADPKNHATGGEIEIILDGLNVTSGTETPTTLTNGAATGDSCLSVFWVDIGRVCAIWLFITVN